MIRKEKINLTAIAEIAILSKPKAIFSIYSKNTAANYECASERAQRRRYEAVLDTVPSTNSIVSIN